MKASPDFRPLAIAKTASGKTIVVGYRPRIGADKEERVYGGAVLNSDGQVVKLFELPRTAEGNGWIPAGHRMPEGDGAAHLILQSGTEPSAIANISESGQVDIIPLATVSGTRAHDWFFGRGVAAELYQFAGEKPPGATQWDTCDLTSGKKISTKTLLLAGFAVGCYLGDEVSVLAHSAHVENHAGFLQTRYDLLPSSLND
jgi:hypothetical protein